MRFCSRIYKYAFIIFRYLTRPAMMIRFAGMLLLLITVSYSQNLHRDAVAVEILLKLLLENQQRDFSLARTVEVAVIYDASDAIAKNEATRYQRIFETVADSLHKISLSARLLPVQRLAQLSGTRYQAAFLNRVPADSLARILRQCGDERILSLAADTSYVNRGVSIGVYLDGAGQPHIWFNIRSLNDEGASFPKEILKLAEQLKF